MAMAIDFINMKNAVSSIQLSSANFFLHHKAVFFIFDFQFAISLPSPFNSTTETKTTTTTFEPQSSLYEIKC